MRRISISSVLDELHTYRGRQGADVALLVRRLRDRLCRDRTPICIGTSATMVSDDASTDPAASVAIVASRLFGTQITSDGVIGESLERATDPTISVKSLGDRLASVVTGEIPETLSDAELRSHALAVWIELEIGLEDGQRLTRRPPITLSAAAEKLAALTGCDVARCQSQIQSLLIIMSKPASERGGSSDRAFLAFKLHQFFSGAGRLYSTLREPGPRKVTLDGQLFDPDDEQARLYPTFFCRNCGQEHHPIVLTEQDGVRKALPRPIDEPPLDDEDKSEQAGYLMPEPLNDEEFSFDGTPDQYPEDWIDPAGRVKSNLRPFAPQPLTIDEAGCHWSARPPCLVSARQVPLLPRLQGPATWTSARNQQAGWPVRGRPEFGDDASCVEHAPLDEWPRQPSSGRQAQASWLHRQPTGCGPSSWAFQRFPVRGASAGSHSRRCLYGWSGRLIRRRIWSADLIGARIYCGQSRPTDGMDARSRDQGSRSDRGRTHPIARPGLQGLERSAQGLAFHESEP